MNWNPGELDFQSLPACHLMYMFGVRGEYLDLCMLQRSTDLCLGTYTNIPSYALLLSLIAKITGYKPGIFTHFTWNTHIYEDHIEGVDEQLTRNPYPAPTLIMNDNIKTLEDLETWVTVDDFRFENYQYWPIINYPFAE